PARAPRGRTPQRATGPPAAAGRAPPRAAGAAPPPASQSSVGMAPWCPAAPIIIRARAERVFRNCRRYIRRATGPRSRAPRLAVDGTGQCPRDRALRVQLLREPVELVANRRRVGHQRVAGVVALDLRVACRLHHSVEVALRDLLVGPADLDQQLALRLADVAVRVDRGEQGPDLAAKLRRRRGHERLDGRRAARDEDGRLEARVDAGIDGGGLRARAEAEQADALLVDVRERVEDVDGAAGVHDGLCLEVALLADARHP